VIFRPGAPGAPGKLWARVCQYVKEPQRCLQPGDGEPSEGPLQVDELLRRTPSFGPFDGAGAVGAGERRASS